MKLKPAYAIQPRLDWSSYSPMPPASSISHDQASQRSMTEMPEAMLPSNADSQHVTTVLPLVVDLDDSLVQTDTLLETLVGVAFKAPRDLASIFGALLQDRAAFKRAA